MSTVITGSVAPGFDDLVDVYARFASAAPDHASALVVRHHGEVVADLQVGDYPAGSRQLLFSVSKLVTTIALYQARAAGLIDLDAPLVDTWTELGGGTAAGVTLRDVLAHRSGFFRLEQPITLEALLAGEEREALHHQSRDQRFSHAYHAYTFGTLVAGTLGSQGAPSVARLIAEFVAEPLGLDLRLGLDGLESTDVRPIRFSPPGIIEDSVRALGPLPEDQALVALLADPGIFNSAEFMRAQSPAMGVIATAESLSRMMAATLQPIDGVELLSAVERRDLTRVQSEGHDGALGVTSRFGSGVQLPFPRAPWTSADAFGHEGAGGAAALADPGLGLAVGFTTDLFPGAPGASPVLLGLLPTLRHLAEVHADLSGGRR